MAREDRGSRTEYDAGAFERAHADEWDDGPTRGDLRDEIVDDAREQAAQRREVIAEMNARAVQQSTKREAAGLIAWSVGRSSDPRFRKDMTQAELAAMPPCPACRKPMVECHGHDRFGDPQGWLTLRRAERS